MIQAINERRSIRRFQTKNIAKQDIRELLESAIKAPSSKNRQPWKFVVVQGQSKKEMIEIFKHGIAREEKEPLLPESVKYIDGAKYTISIMEQAPVAIFIINPLNKDIFEPKSPEEAVYEVCNIQSASAAIENMLLEAQNKGIGSLWICDIFFAYKELSDWLNVEGELIAAVALGYPDETPDSRPRKSIDSVTEWRS